METVTSFTVSKHAFLLAMPINKWFSVADYVERWRIEMGSDFPNGLVSNRLVNYCSTKKPLLSRRSAGKHLEFYCSASNYDLHTGG